MSRRKKLLEQLEVGLDWTAMKEVYFRILYGLPYQIQIDLVRFMMYRYLPIFERRESNLKWPRILLEDLAQWVKNDQTGIPVDGEFAFPADSGFRSSFDGLVSAYYYRDQPFVLTSASVYAVGTIVNARACNVWAADDPEAVEIMSQETYYLEKERWPFSNLAASAVIRREWGEVGKWLWDKEVWSYPDEVDLERMERELSYWKEEYMILIVPSTFEMVDEAQRQYFAERESLAMAEIFERHYASRNVPQLEFVKIWQEVAAVLELAPEKLRPEDRLYEFIKLGGEIFNNKLDQLDRYIDQQCEQKNLPSDKVLETLDDLMMFLATHNNYQ